MSEAPRVWAVVAWRLSLALGLFALLPLGFLAAYLMVYGAPRSAIGPHFYVLAGLWAALAGLRLVVSVAPVGERARRCVSAALVAFMALAMLAFYGAVFLGLQYWGRVTSTDLMSTYVPQAGELLRALGYPPVVVAAASGLLCAAAWFTAYRFLNRHDWVAAFGQTVSRPVAGLLGLLLLTVAGALGGELPYRDWGSRGEPLSLSLFPERGETAMQSHAIDHLRASQIDRNEDAARAAYRPAPSARRSNVILIVADALRADHLSLLGYSRPTSPNLDAMARAGALRLGSSVVTACNESSCGLRALASSRYIDGQAARPITLQEVLKQHDYRVHLVLSGDHTNFYGLRENYGAVDSYFDGASQKQRYVNDDRLVIDHLRGLAPWDGQPAMFQFHLMSSHALGKRFEDTPEFGPSTNYDRMGWRPKDAEMQKQAINFYDRGVLQVDRVTSEILELLKSRGYLRDALVVITGDHGESLGERGRYSHAHSVWEESLRAPFVLLAFGAANTGTLAAGPMASQVDIAPTLLRALAMPIPSTWEGHPLQEEARNRIVYFQQAQLIGLVDGRTQGKLYKHWTDVDRAQQFTFDLLTDPGEKQDQTSQVPESLRQEWQRLLLSRSAAIVPDGEQRHDRALRGEANR